MTPFCSLFMYQDGEYFEVRKLPVSEMMGRTEIELADEWIEITNGIDWREHNRRPVSHGDVMRLGDVDWLYIRTANISKVRNETSDMHLHVKQLSAVPFYSIGRLQVTLEKLANALNKPR